MALTVSELAERTDVSADMLRYYGRKGLLAESGRTEAGHRYYDEAAVERVRFIKGAQWLDLRLEEVGELLDALEGGSCPCAFSEQLVRRRIAEIDQQRARLDEMRELLSRLLGHSPQPATTDGREPTTAGRSDAAAAHGEDHCGCCRRPASAGGDEVRELEARRAAVERRLKAFVGRAQEGS